MTHSFQGDGIVRIRSVWEHDTECFVSNYTNGYDDWYSLSNSFDRDETSKWVRKGWEVVVFADRTHNQRKGFYLHLADGTTYITFHGFDKEVTIERVTA